MKTIPQDELKQQIDHKQAVEAIKRRGFNEELAEVIAKIEALPNYQFYVLLRRSDGRCEVDFYDDDTYTTWHGTGATELEAFRAALQVAKEATR